MFENFFLLKNGTLDLVVHAFMEVFSNQNYKRKNNIKLEQLTEISEKFQTIEDLELFIFSLQLYQIKDLLLEEAKISEHANWNNLMNLDPLSLAYDQISVLKPYTTRVNGALLALLFFKQLDQGETHFMAESSLEFIQSLSKKAIYFQQKGLEPNQILELKESIVQKFQLSSIELDAFFA